MRQGSGDDGAATASTSPGGGSSYESIGPYRLQQKLGEGGMGEVWLAEQIEPIRRMVALKLIKSGMDTKQVIARFEAERQALALMNHPLIAKVYDAGETSRGLPYFVMEYVPGEPITTYCDRQRLTTQERLELFQVLCDGVQHAHQKGIIHRDLKPSNVLVASQGEDHQPKIIDFGVAKATAQRLTEKTMFTELGALIGTPEYMSPEQAEMSGLDVDTRTDIYSMGVILYELLTGVLPFDSKELRSAGFDEIRRRIREVDPPRPSTRIITLGEKATDSAKRRRTEPQKLVSRLRGDLDWITMKALEKDRTRRYASPGEFAADIRRHLDHQPVVACPPSAAYRTRKFVRRHRLAVGAAALAGAGLLAFGVIMALEAERTAKERRRAERVSAFLTDLFKVSDPSEARGNNITAREILDKGADRIVKELANEPEVQAQLMTTMGGVYTSLGLYKSAEPILSRSVEIQRRLLGSRHPDTLTSMDRLAQLYDRSGRYADSERLLREVVESRRRVLGEEHRDTLQASDSLAVSYERQGRYDDAEKLQKEVLEKRRRLFGNDDIDTVASIHDVGAIYDHLGRYKEAEAYYSEAVEIRRRTLGSDHPNTLWAMNNLANVYDKEGRYEDARKLHEETLETRRRVFGDEHPRTLASMNNLANVYYALGRKDEALKTYREVLEINRRVLGPEHPNTLGAINNVASSEADAGNLSEAERMYKEELEVRLRIQGTDHPDTLVTMLNLSSVCRELGQQKEAEQLAAGALATSRRVLGAEHPSTLVLMTALADVRASQGRYDDAEKLLRDALVIQRRVLSETNPDTAASMYGLGCVAAARGDRAAALDWLQQAVGHGFREASAMEREPNLSSLRGDPAFAALVSQARNQPAQ